MNHSVQSENRGIFCRLPGPGIQNPYYRNSGFSQSWVHLILLLAVIMAVNTGISYYYDGSLDGALTGLSIYLWIVFFLLLYLWHLKKEELKVQKAHLIYFGDIQIDRTGTDPHLYAEIALGNPYRGIAYYDLEIPLRTIRHLYLDPRKDMLYIDGDLDAFRRDRTRHAHQIWHGAWISLDMPSRADFMIELHQTTGLTFEEVSPDLALQQS